KVIGRGGQQFRFLILRMDELIASLARCAIFFQDAIHGPNHSGRSDRRGTQAGAFDGRARGLLRLTHRCRRKGHIAGEHGKVVVLRAAGDWEILAINDFDSDIYATPAVSEGKMYIRTRNALYAIGSSN